MGVSVPQLLESIPSPVLLAIGMVMLVAGGHWLVEGAVRISRRFGVSSLIIGMTVVAFGTSAPELAFNLIAAWSDHTELSFGNVVGSNIANITLVIGVGALAGPLVVNSRVVRIELPLLIGISMVTLGLALRPIGHDETGAAIRGFDRLDGILLLCGLGACLVGWYVAGRRAKNDPLLTEAARDSEDPDASTGLILALVMTIAGLVMLVAGGKVAQVGAVHFARWLGLPEVVIGLTIVAFATSLPEIVASVIAVRRGHADLAVGNVIGSNLFNTLLVMGTTSLVASVPAPAPFGLWDLVVMNVLTILLLRIALSKQHRVRRRWGVLLIGCYGVYITWTIMR